MLTDINELWIRYLLLSEQFHYIQHFILFQHISCYSLSQAINADTVANMRFNTSHVTLYLYGGIEMHIDNVFQYISCYSLSATTQLVFQYMSSFNTSHVTLYPVWRY